MALGLLAFRAIISLNAASPQELSQLCQQGFSDALCYLKRNSGWHQHLHDCLVLSLHVMSLRFAFRVLAWRWFLSESCPVFSQSLEYSLQLPAHPGSGEHVGVGGVYFGGLIGPWSC